MLISSQVAACASPPLAFKDHPSTHAHQTGYRNMQVPVKVD